MSTRETLAGMAMMGLLADHKDHSDECLSGETCEDAVARMAVDHADALIAELKGNNQWLRNTKQKRR